VTTFSVELPLPPANRAHPARPWHVLHACESASDAVYLTEAQLAVGMRPRVLAREFWSEGKHVEPPSLMSAWHAVRDWRQALNEAEALTSLQLVHAHSFPAAMAGVRGSLPCVFDFQQTIEESAAATSGVGPWVLRSFRVAEQFALSRAGAVVTHSETMRAIAHERGALAENLFVIPEPIETRTLIANRDWAALHGIDLDYHSAIFAVPGSGGMEPVLRAFANVLSEMEQALLVFELGDLDPNRLLALARELEIADNIRCIAGEERSHAMACATVILAAAPTEERRANPTMLQAMAAGKAVVAADAPANRECSREGRGMIWYREGDVQDMAHRVAFVARNADFSRSLGESGQLHLRNTRASHVVGRLYDDVYQHAYSRRRDNLPKIPLPKLYEANVQV
jgi:glycosyltransferase involved in cell wall biosynthesis